ncbi:uroporphyrinogen decarboxylase [Porphyromonas cangingivalis]|uniref:Uroporphyrinogen decarboxylase n=1 Tax=Porphyromonas cangingivalis TaxID=36874 RepID=A0A1T4JLQ2_PORCN|nr:uroporphyrinogen decarboxylase [Porphyromonas cangingivalis]SJZ31096.1 uroporphyrinogen decarboxylase [Porphyromonas cangingivalis]VEJ04351.1 Uroporphyrinogen decarboxylase [Porphyromonas cangingivalis]
MKPIKNDLILRALRGENTSRTPVWLMRQAGRYLPEYRSVRAKAGSFMDLCRTPELACEVTLQPLRRYDLDAAIIFSDILTVPDAMGLGLSFLENEGPVFERPLRTESDILSLCKPDVMKDLKYVFDAITLTKKELDGSVPLIGFCGSAFTLACYMIEGRGSKGFPRVKELLYSRPELMHTLLDKITDALIDYLNAQIDAGVDIIQIFDTWGGILSTGAFSEFSLTYTERLIQGLRLYREDDTRIPVICFTKDAPLAWYKMYENIGADCVGIDWRHDMDVVAAVVRNIALQGNLDPMVLKGSDEYIVQRVKQIIDMAGLRTPHIFNLGHGMHKDIDPDKVELLVDTVHSYSEERKSLIHC